MLEMKKDWLSWFEIPVSDLGRAVGFYQAIFGVKLDIMDMEVLQMAVFPHSSIGGALVKHEEFYFPSEKGTLIYLNAEPDLSTVLDKVETAGGKIVVPKRQISPDHGFMAVFTDSEGNRVALHSTS